MKISETFWLTVTSMFQVAFIAIGVIAFFLVPKKGRREYLELGLFLIATLVVEVVGWVGHLVFHRNMNIATNAFDFFYLPLLLVLYRRHVGWPNKTIVYVFITIFLLFALINFLFIQGPDRANTCTRFLTSFFFILLAVTYLFNQSKHPLFWVTIALLIYHGVTIYIHIWQEYLVDIVKSNYIGVWMVHNSMGLVHYGLIIYALLLIRTQYILRNSTLN